MTVVITGATGHLGRLTVESLLAKGVPAGDILATGRSVERLAALEAKGVRVAAVDFADPASLDAAFAGADKVLLVSVVDGPRVELHRNAVEAAARAGVGLLVYTSAPKATTTTMLLAADHKATEEIIAASAVPATILRNGWYVENYLRQLPTFREHGMVGAAGDGLVSVAPRREYAEAAATVLATDGHEGKVYELGGEAVTLPQIAAAISSAIGQQITYTDVPVAQLKEILLGARLPEIAATIFSDVDRAIGAGELLVDPADLAALLGRPATGLDAAVKEGVDQV
jgi:NAD(P)H dehydrogenase (quinone)